MSGLDFWLTAAIVSLPPGRESESMPAKLIFILGIVCLVMGTGVATAKPVQSTRYTFYSVGGDTAEDVYSAMLRKGPRVNGAKAYAATRTPHVYLLQNEKGKFMVRYVGAIDDNANDATAVGVKYLEEAIAKTASGQAPEPSFTKAIGCGIKWKKDAAASN